MHAPGDIPPTITGERLVLRPYRPGDERDIVAQANNRDVSVNLRDQFPYPYTHADAVAWIARCGEQDPTVNFAITIADHVIGGIGLDRDSDVFAHGAEIGYWLGAEHWGRGYATEALVAASDWAFTELGLLRLYAGVFSSNPASARVLEKAGYRREGNQRRAVNKGGVLLDRWLYAKLRDDDDAGDDLD